VCEQILLREGEGAVGGNVRALDSDTWSWRGKRLRYLERAGAFLAPFSEEEGKARVSNY